MYYVFVNPDEARAIGRQRLCTGSLARVLVLRSGRLLVQRLSWVAVSLLLSQRLAKGKRTTGMFDLQEQLIRTAD